jgi:hypothetical protein
VCAKPANQKSVNFHKKPQATHLGDKAQSNQEDEAKNVDIKKNVMWQTKILQ